MPDALRITGLDLSFTATGISSPDGHLELVKTKPAPGSIGTVMRCRTIANAIRSELRRTETTHVVVEGFAYGRAEQAHQMGGLGYIVRLMLVECGIPYVDVAPASLKKFATGSGNASKDQVISDAIRQFGFPGSDNNLADAWCLRMMGEASVTGGAGLAKTRIAALRTVEWPWDTSFDE